MAESSTKTVDALGGMDGPDELSLRLWLAAYAAYLIALAAPAAIMLAQMDVGWGELLAGLNVGPLAVLGSYFVQAHTLSWGVVLVSLPTGFLSSALLVTNEIPDAAVDRSVGKNHLVARAGIERAPWAYLLLLAAAYVSAGLGVWMGLVPRTVSLVFLAAPLGLWAFASSRRWVRSNRPSSEMTPAMGANVACLLLSGVLLCAGYLMTRVLA